MINVDVCKAFFFFLPVKCPTKMKCSSTVKQRQEL